MFSFETIFPKDAWCSPVETGQVVLIFAIISLGKRAWVLLEFCMPFSEACYVLSLAEIGPEVLEKSES